MSSGRHTNSELTEENIRLRAKSPSSKTVWTT